MPRLFLGLDVGTQGTKGLLLDDEARAVVARAGVGYGLLEGLPPGAAEQHPQTWIDALQRVSQALLASQGVRAADVAGVGVSGQQHGLVVLDGTGAVVRPAKLWCDTSTAPEARELGQRLGRPVPTGFTASKVAWLARHEPEAWARTRWVLLPHDYVNYRLTGTPWCEAGDASGTGFFDPAARRFDEAAAAEVNERLPGMLPGLVEPGSFPGQLSRDGAALLGLPPGLPVATGSGDNMCSALGSGATRPGVVVISLGTSATAFACSKAPVLDPAGLLAPFCDATGAWLPLLCVMSCTGVTEEVRAAFAAPGAARSSGAAELDALTRAAADVPAGCDGMLWLPYLQGERVPDLPEATGVLLGLRPGSLRPGSLFRAALEGSSLNLAWGFERLQALGVEAREVRLTGGAAANPLWRSILADVLRCPVRRLVETESAALGAALLALWAARRDEQPDLSAHEACTGFAALTDDVNEPHPSRSDLYRQLGQRFREAVQQHFGPSREPS